MEKAPKRGREYLGGSKVSLVNYYNKYMGGGKHNVWAVGNTMYGRWETQCMGGGKHNVALIFYKSVCKTYTCILDSEFSFSSIGKRVSQMRLL